MNQGQLTRTFRPPFVVPDSLDHLRGPASGTLEVPLTVMWPTPEKVQVDLSNPDATRAAYAEILGSASLTQLQSLVNRDLLVELWPVTRDRTIAAAWASRFPELNTD